MKKALLILLSIISNSVFSQVVKDLDGDSVKDSIFYNQENEILICKLSTQKFTPIYSKSNLSSEMSSGVRDTKNGFIFYVNHMRAGYESQFRYEKKDKKIRLIGMSRYKLGPANHDGSGESSVNLLTDSYIGEWNHYDSTNSKLVKMPTIKSKMYFPKIYLEDYDGSSQATFHDKCSALYYDEKKKM